MGAFGHHSVGNDTYGTHTNHQRGAALFRPYSYPVFGYGGIDACGMGQTGGRGNTMHSGLDIVLTLTSPSPPPYFAREQSWRTRTQRRIAWFDEGRWDELIESMRRPARPRKT
eukprot:2450264-Pyramimonas_sp.AAC.1